MDRVDLAQDRELLKCETVGIRNSLVPWFGKVTLCSACPLKYRPMPCCPRIRTFYLRFTVTNAKLIVYVIICFWPLKFSSGSLRASRLYQDRWP